MPVKFRYIPDRVTIMNRAHGAIIGVRQRLRRRAACIAVAIALAVLLAGVALEAWRRHGLYWYEVRQDYVYAFRPGGHVALPVQIGGGAFVQPAREGGADTALLRLRVSASALGSWFEPCLVINAAGREDRQCFERGVQGIRYLLLPPAALEPGLRVGLRGEHLRWPDQSAELLLFDHGDLANGRVLVLAPHPDDAEIAAFGLYSSRDSFIVTMTAGNYVDGRYARLHGDPSVQDALRGDVRVWDSLTVPLWGGVAADRVVSLGYATNSLQDLHAGARPGVEMTTTSDLARYRRGALQELLGGRTATPEWSSVVADLVAVLATVRPAVVVSPHPAMDAAPDHQYTTIALLEALRSLGDESTTLLLYDNHHRWSEHAPFGDSRSRVAPPPWFGGVEFASVYTIELDPTQQLRKLFALESMHDLREPPLRLTGGPAAIFGQRLRQALDLIRRDPVGDYSYFRRAARPNELFFVYRPEDRDALR